MDKKCPKCDYNMKFAWDGNPDGNIAFVCIHCQCYILNQLPPFNNYGEALEYYDSHEGNI